MAEPNYMCHCPQTQFHVPCSGTTMQIASCSGSQCNAASGTWLQLTGLSPKDVYILVALTGNGFVQTGSARQRVYRLLQAFSARAPAIIILCNIGCWKCAPACVRARVVCQMRKRSQMCQEMVIMLLQLHQPAVMRGACPA